MAEEAEKDVSDTLVVVASTRHRAHAVVGTAVIGRAGGLDIFLLLDVLTSVGIPVIC